MRCYLQKNGPPRCTTTGTTGSLPPSAATAFPSRCVLRLLLIGPFTAVVDLFCVSGWIAYFRCCVKSKGKPSSWWTPTNCGEVAGASTKALRAGDAGFSKALVAGWSRERGGATFRFLLRTGRSARIIRFCCLSPWTVFVVVVLLTGQRSLRRGRDLRRYLPAPQQR